MNILAIADVFVPEKAMCQPLSSLQPSHLRIIEWESSGMAEVHRRIRSIERDGPEAEPVPDAIWDHLSQAELIVTHMCPVNREMIRRADRLRMIGVCRAGIENIEEKAAEARNIRLYNVPGRNAAAVAEFTVA